MRFVRCFSKRALQVKQVAPAPTGELKKLQTGVQSDMRSAAAAVGRLGACGLVQGLVRMIGLPHSHQNIHI